MYLIIDTIHVPLDTVRDMVGEDHAGPLPEVLPPEDAPRGVGARLCLEYEKLEHNIALFCRFNSDPHFSTHLVD